MIRIAMLSYWHVHAWEYTGYAVESPQTEVVAVWDDDAERGRAAAEKLGVEFVADLDALLARDDIDAVVNDTPTTMHREVLVKAARAGKHIFTEKVLGATLADAEAIIDAVDAAGVKLVVSLPRLNMGVTQAVRSLLEEGALGEPVSVRVRLAHDGALSTERNPDGWLPAHFYDPEQTVGGAMIDLGCHPMYLTRLFLGGSLPETVTARFGFVTGRQVEDNAVAVLTTAEGALGVVEAGFATPCSPFSIEVQGTGGTAIYGNPDERLLARRAGEDAFTEVPLPDETPKAFTQWIGHITSGTTADENVELARDLSALMEAVTRSAAEDRPIRLDDLPR